MKHKQTVTTSVLCVHFMHLVQRTHKNPSKFGNHWHKWDKKHGDKQHSKASKNKYTKHLPSSRIFQVYTVP